MKTAHDSAVPAVGQQVITACAFIHHNFEVSQSGGLTQEVASDFDARKNRDNLNSPCKGVEKLFLPKRADTKKFLPGIYELPGGHIDFGEELIPGLIREIDEEFGIAIKVGDPFAAFTYENKIKGSHSVEVVYFAQFAEPLDNITLDPEDHSSFDWFTKEDVLARKGEVVAQEHVSFTHEEDPEYLTMLRGFELLEGKSLQF